jgi:cyclase
MLDKGIPKILALISAMVAVLSGGVLLTIAQGPGRPQPVSVHSLGGGVYWTQGGSGANTGFIIGTDGVIIIDAKQTADAAKDVLTEIAKLTPKPVTHIILTHSNPDHVKGLSGYPKGLTIIAQENCKQEIEELYPDLHDYFPTRTVKKKESLKIDGVRLELFHFAPAHTSGDLVVYLPDQKIAFVGDLTVGMPYPRVHLEDKGSSAGLIESLKGLVAVDADRFVRGHFDPPVQTKAEVEMILAATAERWAKIKELVGEGKSLGEIQKALGEPVTAPTPTPAAASQGGRFPTFTEIAYKEVSKT